MPSLAFHDAADSTPGVSSPGSAARGVWHQPKSPFGISRNLDTAELALEVVKVKP